MKFIKTFEWFRDEIDSIRYLCSKYHIKNYTINDDMSIDVDGNVYISNIKLDKIPLIFNEVSGNFHCAGNRLTSLEGCPSMVGGNFYCMNNQLTSLEGCPKKVGGGFDCSYNRIKSLKGCPVNIGGYFDCGDNRVYEVWKLINDKQYLELFLDYDIINGDEISLIKLNDILDMIGKPNVTEVEGYKCI